MSIAEREGWRRERERERESEGERTVRRHQPKESSGRRELSGVGRALAEGEGPRAQPRSQ